MTVTRTDLEADLRALGLDEGDVVTVHSSLSSLGWVEGGAETVVDALLAVVGEEGTVLMPTFTFGHDEDDPFDRAASPSTTGAVTEALRRRPDAERSSHPTHSVSAVGADAADLTSDHEHAATLGPGSPLHRAAKRGGKILLVGVDNRRNSTLHVAEQLVDVAHKQETREVAVRADDAEGDAVRVVETAAPGCGRGFDAVEPPAERAGLLRRGSVADADAQLLDGGELLACAVGMLWADPTAFLCDHADCTSCTRARRLYGG